MDSRETPAAAAASMHQSQSHHLRQPTSYNYNHSTVSSQTLPVGSNSNSASPFMQTSRFPLNSSAPPTVDGLSSPFADGSLNIVPDKKKKRGRPRKYSSDSGIGLGLNPDASPTQVTPFSTSGHGFSGTGSQSSDPRVKKSRGRPPSSGKKQLDSLGPSGVGFTPHVILVHAGEDIASKIMAFSQEGPRTICILSANGAVCNVTLHQPASSGGTVTYEGRFEIISLSGSFELSESNGSTHGRSSSLSVSLAGSDGRVLGGNVAGMLTAATPVQVIVGSFVFAEVKKPKAEISSTPFPRNMLASAVTSPPSQSQGGSSDSSDDNGGSPFNQGGTTTLFNNNSSHHHQPQHHNMSLYSNMGWGK
ncbi:AT-hook motif nuclear-localized protein 8-like [Impatiens glandulifera]|uniref:AT-hook motif nuclear-localized protein 8-like n=1 Tax=Impatiens glandulifera TaxID=253017 RepID=UPI001FB1A1B8|nr:AT-hook motif nuclear-localized protein 8-like [Impatiens glandulifera]